MPQPYYEVLNISEVHNHKTGPEIYVWYAMNRALTASEKDQLKDLISCNATSKDIKEVVLEKTGKFITSQDVRNLRHATVKKIKDSAHHGALLLEKINKLFSENTGWKVHIEKNADNDLLYILLQSKHMAQLAEKYPEVLFFDGTYKVNKEGYILHSVLCEDGTSHGRPVCYAFVQRETSEILKSFLETFLCLNPVVKNKCKVAVMDKDLNEMNIITQLLPECRILLCSWHVLKYLHTKVMQHDSKSIDKMSVKDVITKLVFAHTVDIYKENLLNLETLLKDDRTLLEFFYKNWHSCKSMWVHAYRSNVHSLGNNTNNRMESHNQKLKRYLRREMHLVEAVKALVGYVTHDALSVSHAQYRETKLCIDTSKTDTFYTEVSAKCTEYAKRLVCKEYETYKKNPGKCSASGDKHVVSVNNKCYEVSDRMRACICTFNMQYKLPCRHIFAARSEENEKLFDECCVPQRWLKSDFVDTDLTMSTDKLNILTTSITKKAQPKLDTPEARYKYVYARLLELSKATANILAQYSETELNEKLGECEDFFHNLVTYSRNKKEHSTFDEMAQSSEQEISIQEDVESEGELSISKSDVDPDDGIPVKSINDNSTDKDCIADESQDLPDVNNCTIVSHAQKICQALAKGSDPNLMPSSNAAQQLTVLSIPLVQSARGRPRKRRRVDHTNQREKKRCLTVSDNSKFKQQASLPDVYSKTAQGCIDNIAEAICGSDNCNPYKINTSELKALRGTGWLSDAIINAALYIISRQFPDIGGFQDVLLGERFKFKKQNTFIQILHVPGHWVTVTNYGAPKDTVFLYDSLDQAIPDSAVHQIINIVNLSSNVLNVHAKAAQRQENSYDCGVFAIANAFTIASGVDPCTATFDKSKMRRHLISCLADNEMIHFPSSALPVPRVEPKWNCFFVPE
ncbi:uncharacterized protein [Dermacentor andersoni]|uniref:uncharacterized protein n=2 Tax=Dermacentor andersoni TaxID=34620 RepID=UPI003B3A9B0C